MHHIPQDEPAIREAMQRLLEPLFPWWVAQAVGVTPQTVAHWKNGRHTSAERLEQVAGAVRNLLPEHEEAVPPAWAERLKAEVLDGLREELTLGAIDELVARVVEQLEARRGSPPPPRDESQAPPGAPDDAQSTAR
jgi:transcriptional regulator with XRE-family HTH domain